MKKKTKKTSYKHTHFEARWGYFNHEREILPVYIGVNTFETPLMINEHVVC